MNRQEDIKGTICYTLIAMATIIIFGAIFVVIHEYIHSTTAYLLGHMHSPLDIQWGNLFTLDGWDEGVSYSAMFNAGQGIDAAIIAFSPLFFQSSVVILGMYLLLSERKIQKKWTFHLVYWLVIVNFMELVAYMPSRAFALHGDIGNINHGLGLNPWILFVIGSLIILTGLYILFRRILPKMYVIIAGESRLTRYVILIFSVFYLFIFRTSISEALHFTPDMPWLTGLFGYAGCIVILYFCRPNMPWIMKAEKLCMSDMQNK